MCPVMKPVLGAQTMHRLKGRGGRGVPMEVPIWDERQAYEELLYWEDLVRRGKRLRPDDFKRYEDLSFWYERYCFEEDMRYQEDMRAYEAEMRYWEEYQRYEEELRHYEYLSAQERSDQAVRKPKLPSTPGPAQRPTCHSEYERHVLAKHTAIYPTQGELEAVQTLVTVTEKALKLLSDDLDTGTGAAGTAGAASAAAAAPGAASAGAAAAVAVGAGAGGAGGAGGAVDPADRTLRGVMRAGPVAKGLLLKGDLELALVLICKDKPTKTLLGRIVQLLPKHLKTVRAQAVAESKESFAVENKAKDAALLVHWNRPGAPTLTITVTLTCPLIREEADRKAEADKKAAAAAAAAATAGAAPAAALAAAATPAAGAKGAPLTAVTTTESTIPPAAVKSGKGSVRADDGRADGVGGFRGVKWCCVITVCWLHAISIMYVFIRDGRPNKALENAKCSPIFTQATGDQHILSVSDKHIY